jgi:hypothetical protein
MLPGADEYLRAFNELVGDRQPGGPIMFASVDRWAVRNGMDGPDEFSGLLSALAAMDEAMKGDGPASQGRPLSPELFDAVFG